MARTIPAALQTALATIPRKSADCVILEARDGTLAGFTTYDVAQSVDVGEAFGPVSCSLGMNPSGITFAEGVQTSSFEIEGAATGEFTRAKVRGGKWRSARAWLVWLSPGEAGFAKMMRGRVGEGRVEKGRVILEIRNAADALAQAQGVVLSPYCRRTFGDAATGCPVVRTAYPTEIVSVESAFRFAVDLAGVHPDHFFRTGSVDFLTGDLAGIDEVQVFAYDGTLAVVELEVPLVEAPTVGDTLNLYRGCTLLIHSDDVNDPTCSSYGVAEYHKGHADVPGSNFYLRTSPAGSTSE